MEYTHQHNHFHHHKICIYVIYSGISLEFVQIIQEVNPFSFRLSIKSIGFDVNH